MVKNLLVNAGATGDTGLMLDWEHPLEEEITPHSSILLRQSHGQRSLVGYI